MVQVSQSEDAMRPSLMAWRRSFSFWSWIRILSIARDIVESGAVGLCRKIPSDDRVRVEVFLSMSLVYFRSGQIDRACGPLPQLADLYLDPSVEVFGLGQDHVTSLE
jgi:hypothetical protein